MAANDNAMTRFLFAILQQKCLKDIDWNKVAHDPILAQSITNGHAARMRYSRFRAAMLGLEPQRRNRTNPSKARVSKKKKGEGKPATEPKKEDGEDNQQRGEQKDEVSVKPEKQEHNASKIKPEPGVGSAILRQGAAAVVAVPVVSSPKVKQETAAAGTVSTPTTEGPQYTSPVYHRRMAAPLPEMMPLPLNARLLTPCSDSDMLYTSPGPSGSDPFCAAATTTTATASPRPNDLLHHQHLQHHHHHSSHHGHHPDMFDFSGQNASSAWRPGSSYSTVSLGLGAYELDAYGPGGGVLPEHYPMSPMPASPMPPSFGYDHQLGGGDVLPELGGAGCGGGGGMAGEMLDGLGIGETGLEDGSAHALVKNEDWGALAAYHHHDHHQLHHDHEV